MNGSERFRSLGRRALVRRSIAGDGCARLLPSMLRGTRSSAAGRHRVAVPKQSGTPLMKWSRPRD